MTTGLFTSKGIPINIGRELGKGGEGSVFEVHTLGNQVAKLYHKAPDLKKQAKLSFMASNADEQLLNYIAWPQETLHPSIGGPVVGFLMPNVSGKEPIHMLYSPAYRRQGYPQAAWDFLLYVARNIASSFGALHAHGHVIGDVNQNSFMVGRDSKVILIDSDSFQINAHGTLHLCEVGVSHFTPPELQSLSSFNGFTRTTNHDNFGLALLIFHVLLGGRHPYSGVPLRSGVGDALETDIKHFRYAYARDYQSRGISPPPRSIRLSMLPDDMESMFQMAFTERGASGQRPSAQNWVAALDALRRRLKKCSASGMHTYPDHLSACPWCELENQGVVYFVDLVEKFTSTSSGFVLSQAWGLIQSVTAPSPISFPSPSSLNLTPRQTPAGIKGNGITSFYRMVAIVISAGIIFASPNIWYVGLLIGLTIWVIAGSARSAKINAEQLKRKNDLEAARQEYNNILGIFRNEAGPGKFNKRLSELENIKNNLERLPLEENEEIDTLQYTAHTRQKQRFLETCFIDSAVIQGVGTARKIALRSFGIETAADVTKTRVLQVWGFGEGLTRAVLNWRTSCERQFKFNSAAAVSQRDRNSVRAKYAKKRVELEQLLASAPSELKHLRESVLTKREELKPLLEEATQRLAQAQIDFIYLKNL